MSETGSASVGIIPTLPPSAVDVAMFYAADKYWRRGMQFAGKSVLMTPLTRSHWPGPVGGLALLLLAALAVGREGEKPRPKFGPAKEEAGILTHPVECGQQDR